MWTLVVLIVGTLPPQGTLVKGFADLPECLAASQEYCAANKRLRCKCVVEREP